MNTSLFELFKIGIGPSSSHTVGPMRAALRFVHELDASSNLDRTHHVVADLYGSLALTGIGHGTDRAILLGLSGQAPDTVDPAPSISRSPTIRETHQLQLLGTHSIPFVESEHLLFHRDQMYPIAATPAPSLTPVPEDQIPATLHQHLESANPESQTQPATHPNGLRFSAFDSDNHLLATSIFYSVGGGFIVSQAEFHPDAPIAASSRSVPYPFSSAQQLLALADQHTLSIAELILANEIALLPDTTISRPTLTPATSRRTGANHLLACHSDLGLPPGRVRSNPAHEARLSPKLDRGRAGPQPTQPHRAKHPRPLADHAGLHRARPRHRRHPPRRSQRPPPRTAARPETQRRRLPGSARPHGLGHRLRHGRQRRKRRRRPRRHRPHQRRRRRHPRHRPLLHPLHQSRHRQRRLRRRQPGRAGPLRTGSLRRHLESARRAGLLRYFLTAAAIGILYKENASISGAEVGCQGEVGVACSMAAGGLVAALNGSNAQIEHAAEIAMEHNLGMTCDPIGGLVQIPCIERNGMGAVKAINAARLAMADTETHKLSLDQIIETMYRTGMDMQSRYKETSLAGLALNIIEC